MQNHLALSRVPRGQVCQTWDNRHGSKAKHQQPGFSAGALKLQSPWRGGDYDCSGDASVPILILAKEGSPMASDGRNDLRSYLYLGLAGETGPGRAVHTGLCRLADGSDEWELLQSGLPEAPAVRALAVHPLRSEIIYAGTQSGPYRSADHGEHWEKVSHGQYVNDDTVDMHGVLASRWRPNSVYAIGRAGMFHSADGGDHWRTVPLEPLNPKGQIYCRDIREVPGNPRKLWVAAGGGFQSDVGVLLKSSDGGDSWTRVDIGLQPAHTMFALAFDERP